MVNSLRVAFNRTSINRGSPPFFDPLDLGVQNFHTYRDGEMVLAVTGGFNISAATSTTGIFWTNSYQAADDVTLVRGNHQMGFGVNVAYWKSSQTSHARSGGSFMFNGQTTGRGLADLLVGALGSLEHGVPNLLVMDMVYAGVYAQDSWRVSDRVTFNYGVRWEPFLGQQMLYGGATNFSHDEFLKGTKSTVFLNAPPGMTYPGDAGFPDGKSGYHKRFLDFSPRAGVAWDVRGDGRLAIRSSYGLTYDFPSGDFMNINASAPPWGNRSLITTTRFDDPYAIVGGNPHPIATNANTVFPPFGAFGVMDPNIEPPRVQSWNITVEQQLWQNWSVTANYLGRYSDHLWAEVGLNPGVFLGLGPCTINGASFAVCSTNANLNQRRTAEPREPGVGRHARLHRPAQRRRLADVPRVEAHHDSTRCFWLGHQWELHGVGVRGHGHAGELRADRQRVHESRRSGHGQGALRPGPLTPGECHRGLHDSGVGQSGREHAGSELEDVGHPLGAVGPVDEHHHRHGQRTERPDRAASESGV